MERRKATAKEMDLHLRLYIADETPKSLNALANLEKICEEHLECKYHIEVLDILKDPQAARRDQIYAIPTLLTKAPRTLSRGKRLIGDLSDTPKVIAALRL